MFLQIGFVERQAPVWVAGVVVRSRFDEGWVKGWLRSEGTGVGDPCRSEPAAPGYPAECAISGGASRRFGVAVLVVDEGLMKSRTMSYRRAG